MAQMIGRTKIANPMTNPAIFAKIVKNPAQVAPRLCKIANQLPARTFPIMD